MIHAKKFLSEYFEAELKGDKPFDLRREDPDEPAYAVGDYLALNEWKPGITSDEGSFTGRCLLYKITYVLRGSSLLAPGVAALGLRLMPLSAEDLPALKAAARLPRWQ